MDNIMIARIHLSNFVLIKIHSFLEQHPHFNALRWIRGIQYNVVECLLHKKIKNLAIHLILLLISYIKQIYKIFTTGWLSVLCNIFKYSTTDKYFLIKNLWLFYDLDQLKLECLLL